MRTFLARVLDVVLRRSRERRMDDEIQAHLDLLADEYVATGLPRHDAELAARKAFGGVVMMIAIALLSCAGLVRRSLRVDPLIALRDDQR